jgi:XTP/dITP diphosphohydrolase
VREPLLIGTRNRGKVAELRALLNGLRWEIKCLADLPPVPDPVEDGDSFEANAVKKAVYFREKLGVWCVADDSGLVVDALGGAPGVLSARYSGEGANDVSNNAKLLAALADTPEPLRTARFVCCIALARPGLQPQVETGVAEGRIAFECHGRGGFGYDPLFIPEGFAKTFGEMDPAEKLTVSHRGRALRKLRAYLESLA